MKLILEPNLNDMEDKDIYFHRPALPICLALMGGICVGSWFPHGDVWALGCALFGVALILRRVSLGKPAEKAPLGLLFVLGYFSLQPYVAPILPSYHVINYEDGISYEITGRIATSPVVLRGRQTMHLAVKTLMANGNTKRARGYLRLSIYGDIKRLNIGDRIRFNGRIKKIKNFSNPGGFDYQRYMAFKGIRATTYC
ncbi:MAG: ComEC/Rec2 family competence protein, partial [Desulfobacteraceae bacterium]